MQRRLQPRPAHASSRIPGRAFRAATNARQHDWVSHVQAALGNQATARILASHNADAAEPYRKVEREEGQPAEEGGPAEAPVTGQPAASEPGEETNYASLPSLGAPAANKPQRLPIVAGLHRNVTVRRGAVPLDSNHFGLTASELATSNMHVAVGPTSSVYVVDGQLDHTITWDVWSGAGPTGQTNIKSEADPNITSGNYRDVARDLRPDDHGVPPRINYWAEDLSAKHEIFHAFSHMRYYREGLELALGWLNGKTATSDAEVVRLVEKARNRIAAYGASKTQTSMGSTEERAAYEAGAPAYLARSEAILQKGRAGGYPP